MNPIVINGTVLCDNITGIPRYVYENVVRLDKLIEGTGLDVRIAYRDDGRPIHLPELKTSGWCRSSPSRILQSGRAARLPAPHPCVLRGPCQRYAADPPQRRGAARHPPAGPGYRQGLFRFKFWVHCLSTKWFAQRVFTVSDNQRHLISEKLGIPLDKIGITYNGWEHMKNVTPDESILTRCPASKRGVLLRPRQSGKA